MDDHQQRLADGAANLEAALAYLKMGWSVLSLCPPDHVGVNRVYYKHAKTCDTPGKRPWHDWTEYQSRLATEEEVREWWRRLPNANVGMALGPVSKLIRVDIEGQSGEAKLMEMSSGDLPRTLEFKSGRDSGGRGLLYAIPDGVSLATTYEKPKAGEEVRLQAKGAQTVLPPSRHKSGNIYLWLPGQGPTEIDAAPAPAWLIAKLAAKASKKDSRSVADWEKILTGVQEGGRNDNLAVLIGGILSDIRDLRDARSIERAIQSSLALNDRNDPPQPEDVVVAMFRSLHKKETARREELDHGGLDLYIAQQIEASASLPIAHSPSSNGDGKHEQNGDGKHDDEAREVRPWHLVIVKSEPVEYRLRTSFWKDSPALKDGYLILSSAQILDWPRSIRKAALNQAQVLIPKKAENWDTTDGHLDNLIKTATVIETTPESQRKLYVLGFIYRYLAAARPIKIGDGGLPQWSAGGRPVKDTDSSTVFKLANLKKEVKNAKEDFLHREVTRLLEEFGAAQCFIQNSRWWRVSEDTMKKIGLITKELDG